VSVKVSVSVFRRLRMNRTDNSTYTLCYY